MKRGLRHPRDIFTTFNIEKVTIFNPIIGQHWKNVVRQYIVTINNERYLLEKSHSFIKNLLFLQHNCNIKGEHDVELGFNWLMMLLNTNATVIHIFLEDIKDIMDKKCMKVNTLCFIGETNTSKTMLANLITSHLTVGTINRRGDQSQFHFDNLLNRTVGVMEVPRITNATKNDFKALLGGDRFEIDGPNEFLERIPIIATTNEDLGVFLHHIERNVLYSRVKQCELKEQI
ncbi:unnamed protein product [Hymenolepis diminuta]|uniref:Parvovirus non-structural protein 1 helicase domain-containing protein n=1 Tax=Hymenolepis diminuta TaxID=6216 RepID=A0A564Z9P1_HYMDI|nr:unnamed protein product [Hymenolepis diminuta]